MSLILKTIAEKISKKNGWQFIDFLGAGAFKEAYRIDINNQSYALKICNPKKSNRSRTDREIEAMLLCDSERIAKIIDCGAYTDPNGQNYQFMVEEYLEGGNLTDFMKLNKLSITQIKRFGIHLTEALSHLESHGLVHRDIKPDNIMFTINHEELKLVDFGIVRNLSKSSLTASWIPRGPGTPYYSSPEQLNNEKALIDWRSDQFSLGLVLGQCLTGHHPFEDIGMAQVQVVDDICNRKKLPQKFIDDANNSQMSFIVKMLEPWPVNRFFSPDKLIAAINL